jgi:hypothetical protein
MATQINNRGRADALLRVTVALPNAANTVNTNSIDLETVNTYPLTEDFQVRLSTATAGNGLNNATINVRIQTSTDNSNWTNAATTANPALTLTDNNNAGYNVTDTVFSLQPGAYRYIRAQATGTAGGGNAANANITLELRF